jgi:hypothetical protein
MSSPGSRWSTIIVNCGGDLDLRGERAKFPQIIVTH